MRHTAITNLAAAAVVEVEAHAEHRSHYITLHSITLHYVTWPLWPSSRKRTQSTGAAWPCSVAMHASDAVDQTRTVQSPAAVAISFSAGENSTAQTLRLWPLSVPVVEWNGMEWNGMERAARREVRRAPELGRGMEWNVMEYNIM